MSLYDGFSTMPQSDPAKVEYIVVSDRETYPFSARLLKNGAAGPLEEWELECLATDAAEDDYSNCDGWERTTNRGGGYPIEVELYVDGAPAGRFSVDIDFSPEFTARKCAGTSSEVPL